MGISPSGKLGILYVLKYNYFCCFTYNSLAFLAFLIISFTALVERTSKYFYENGWLVHV